MSDTSQPQREHQPPPVQFELDSYPVTLLRVGDRRAEYDEEVVQRVQLEHVSYVLSLQAAGHVLAAGALTGHVSINGLGFFTPGTTESEIRAQMDQDPAIKAGMDAYEILTFMCPRGALAFPRSSHYQSAS